MNTDWLIDIFLTQILHGSECTYSKILSEELNQDMIRFSNVSIDSTSINSFSFYPTLTNDLIFEKSARISVVFNDCCLTHITLCWAAWWYCGTVASTWQVWPFVGLHSFWTSYSSLKTGLCTGLCTSGECCCCPEEGVTVTQIDVEVETASPTWI